MPGLPSRADCSHVISGVTRTTDEKQRRCQGASPGNQIPQNLIDADGRLARVVAGQARASTPRRTRRAANEAKLAHQESARSRRGP
jgi:hypothetical protein